MRTMAALRSGLRRYPPELMASLVASKHHPDGPVRDLLSELSPHGLASAWLGHASVIARVGNLSVLVDPVLSTRIGPRIIGRTIGPARLDAIPLSAGSLRGVDLLLLTHAHFDHLDRPTLLRLRDERTTVVVPRRCKRLIPDGFAKVLELGPGEQLTFAGATLEVHTPRHWGARGWIDRRRGYNAYVIRSQAGNVLFAGDTAYTKAFDDLSALDLAVFGIGAYEPWEHMHATPEQVWQMATSCDCRYLMPVHHSTFQLSDEHADEPLQRLYAAAGPQADRVLASKPGEVLVLPSPANQDLVSDATT
jgi:L-ascorbate metabolism protein UlaG (beta-lactamase superfamily)